MAFWNNVKALFVYDDQRSASLANPPEWLYTLLGGKKSSAGVVVNPETALAHAAVYACNKVLAESVASLPLEFFQSDGLKTKLLSGDPRYFILNSEPSNLYTSYSFRIAVMLHLGLEGNSYARIFRDGNQRVKEVRLYARPSEILPEFDPEGNLWYRVPGEKLPLRPRDILHFRGVTTDGIMGRSPISLFRETIGLGLVTTETQGSLWKNGMLTMGYLKHPAKLNPDQVTDIKENFRLNYAGKENAGRMPVLQNGMEYVPLTMKPSDAMFIETAKLSRHDICAIYRVPPHMIGDLERSTNNNIEHQSLEFVRDTLRPLLKGIEQELDRKMLFDNEKQTKYFRFNVDGLLRGDTKSRAEFFSKALGSTSAPGWMMANEVRVIQGLNPVPGGDVLYSPTMNSQTGAEQQTDTENEQDTNEPGEAQ